MKKSTFSVLLILIFILSISVAYAESDMTTDMDASLDSAEPISIDDDLSESAGMEANAGDSISDDSILQDEEDEWIYTYIGIDSPNLLEGEDASINVNLTYDNDTSTVIDKDISVNVYSVDENYDEELVLSQSILGSGTISIPSSNLALGSYVVHAEFVGDGLYDYCSRTTYFLVRAEKETPHFELGTDGYYTSNEYLSFTFDLMDSNNISIPSYADVYLNGIYNCTVYSEGETNPFDFYDEITQKMEYTVMLVFKGDSAFNPVNHTFTMYPRDRKSDILINLGSIVYGQDANIELILYDEDSDGYDTIYQNFTVCIWENTDDPSGLNLTYSANGTKVISIPSAQLKNNASYTISAIYGGDNVYTPSSAERQFSVYSLIPTDFYASCASANIGDGTIYYSIGDTVELYYEFMEDAGDFNNIQEYLDIYLNGEYYATVLTKNGQDFINISGLSNRFNTITFVFNGTESYAPFNYTLNVTRYEKRSSLKSEVPYILLGNDGYVFLNLTDGNQTINEDFLAYLYKYSDYEAGNAPLAVYTVHNGCENISIPSSLLNKYGSYALRVEFGGNDVYVPLAKLVNLFVHDEKQQLYISIPSYSDEVNSNSTEITFRVVDNGNHQVPALVDVYLNGEFYTTVNYTGGYNSFTVEGLNLGQNSIKLVINGTDFQNPANETIHVSYTKKYTEISLDCYESEIDIYEKAYVYIYLRDEFYNYFDNDVVDIYINGVKNSTFNLSKEYFTFTTATPGEYNITAVYLGNSSHYASNQTIAITVNYKEINTSTYVNLDASTYTVYDDSGIRYINLTSGRYVNFTPYLYDGDGNSLDYNVAIYINDSKVATVKSSSNYRFNLTQKGVYRVSAKFEGKEPYEASEFSNYYIVTVIPIAKYMTFNVTSVNPAGLGETIVL